MSITVDNLQKLTDGVQGTYSSGINSIKDFILSTPPEVIVSLVAGFAIQLFDTRLALPFYGMILSSTLCRVVIYIIGKFNNEASIKITEATMNFHEKFAIIPIILLIAATVFAWFVPPAGFAAGLAIGFYYGPIA